MPFLEPGAERRPWNLTSEVMQAFAGHDSAEDRPFPFPAGPTGCGCVSLLPGGLASQITFQLPLTRDPSAGQMLAGSWPQMGHFRAGLSHPLLATTGRWVT